MPQPGQYNCIFEKLVLDKKPETLDRLAGMVAYSIYKLKKNEFYKSYNDEHGQDPDDNQIAAFLRTINLRERESLERTAGGMLFEFANTYTQEEQQAIIEDSILDEVKEQNSVWSNVWQNLVSSFIFSIIAFVLLAVMVTIKEDWNVSKIFKALTHENVTLQVVEQPAKNQDSSNP